MLTKTQIALIVVAMTIVILFAFTYFVLFKMAFMSRIKLINNGLEDVKIDKAVTIKYKRFIKKRSVEQFILSYQKPKGKNKAASMLVDIVVMLVAIISISLISIGIYFRVNDQQVFIQNKTMLVVTTNSMASVNPDNTYITDNNLTNQIKTRSLIQLEKTNQYDIYDVCAFNSKGRVIVHRIIDKKVEDGKTYYTFRGDANPLSLAEEIKVSEEQIIGELTNFSSVFLGTSIMFLQSGIGMITILVSLIIYAFYSKFYDKEDEAFNERCKVYVLLKYQEYLDSRNRAIDEIVDKTKEQVITVTLNNDTICDFEKITILSHFEKLMLYEDNVKDYYNELKSYILSYGLSNRVSKDYETFKYKSNKVFMLEMRGKTLRLNINKPNDIFDPKYHTGVNTRKRVTDYETFFKLTSDRSLKYAKEIIDLVLSDYNLTLDYKYIDYLSLLKLENDNTKYGKTYSFLAKLSLADESLREQYNVIKNKILSYKGLKNRMSKNYETYNYKHNKAFLIELRGSHIKLHLNKAIDTFEEKYHLKLNTNKRALYYPCYLKIKSNRSLKYALELIDLCLNDFELKVSDNYNDYLRDIPKKDIETLLSEGEITLKKRK